MGDWIAPKLCRPLNRTVSLERFGEVNVLRLFSTEADHNYDTLG